MTNKTMTPVELEALLQIYYSNNYTKTPATDSAVGKFKREKWVLLDEDGDFVVTEIGSAFIQSVLSTPLPVKKEVWVGANDEIICFAE